MIEKQRQKSSSQPVRLAQIPPRTRRYQTIEQRMTNEVAAIGDEELWEEADGDRDDQEPEERPTRKPSSAIPYRQTRPQPAANQSLIPLTPGPQPQQHRKQKHPLLYMCVGAIGAGALATLILGPGVSWAGNVLDELHYGNPRTFQTDAVVGHHDSPAHESHFIALNLHGQILVIEIPGGDPSKAQEFLITTLMGQDAQDIPVTLSFQDVNGDGKPDLLIHLQGQTIVYLNDNGTFRPLKPGEQINQ